MASSRLSVAPLLLAAGALVCACAGAQAPGNGKDAGVGNVGPTDWRPAAAFIGGTKVIEITSPVRCEETGGNLADLTFKWTPSGEARVYVGVFDEQPSIANGAVTNPDHVVWAWQTGGSRSDAGQILWRQGFSPDANGLPDLTSKPPAQLATGVYWLVTWASDATRTVVASSETRPFFWNVTGDPTPYCCDIEKSTTEGVHFWCQPEGQGLPIGLITCDPAPTCG